jgi:hypothetical protein
VMVLSALKIAGHCLKVLLVVSTIEPRCPDGLRSRTTKSAKGLQKFMTESL